MGERREAVIVEAVRTPVGRYGGALKEVRPDDLAALAIRAAVERSGVAPADIEDVLFGDANQAGEDNRNVARMAALLAGLPETVAGATINRLCGSGLQAVNSAAQAIACETGDLFVAGGVESMSRAPFVMAKPEAAFPRGDLTLHDTTIGWRFTNPKLAALHHPFSMGETAENVARRYGIGRQEQDAFALESQRRAAAAIREGRFKDEIVPVEVPGRRGQPPTIVDTDEHPRPDTSAEALARLRPVFATPAVAAANSEAADDLARGTVTAGNASGINDGAAALVVTSADYARAHGLRPLARVVTSAVAGVDPACMGLGPIPATRKALRRAGLTVGDLDLIELNEAFAAQSLACIRDLELDPAKVNVNGGAIAIGHPLGSTGARLMTTLCHELRRRGGRYGLVTMCIGVGQGIATIVERVA
ncbi:MAG TPA: thiolase family protein [Thermomicrobiales bacterium]|nr:thiolase family protein [Thermomicrobiales bacterium]